MAFHKSFRLTHVYTLNNKIGRDIISNTKNWLFTFARQRITNLRDFFYPPLCVLCYNPLAENNDWFCPECIEKLEQNVTEREACPRCSHNRKIKECTCDIAWDHYFERAFSFFDFDETVQDIAHHIKYKGKKSLAYYVGKEYSRLIPDEFYKGIDGILSVPLHYLRKMKRGYNQADHLARGIIEGSDRSLPYLNRILLRKKYTRTQTKLDREERQKNLANAFTVDSGMGDYIKGKNLILVDDVVTTGATTDLCTRVLLDAGVREVRVVSMART